MPEINLLIDLAKYFEASIDYLLCSDYLKGKDVSKYNILKAEDEMSLEKIVEKIILLIKSQQKIYLNVSGRP